MIKTLFVGNLPWSVNEESLAAGFARDAQVEVISARVASDRDTGRSRGFGFVEIPADQADAVVQAMNGIELEGRSLTVNEAQPRPARNGNGNGGGRRY